ncbi:uncharacterized protein [Canis lupus baileyi]|uniref:uncharacterized protein isoform X3 n=1 Tax=Canis lupus baileyi TaxID=143281 RepID=UPI003B96EC44
MGSRGWRGLTGAAQQGRSLFRPCAGTWQPMSQGRKAQEFGRSRVTMALSGEVTSQQKPGEVTPAGLRDVVRVDFGRAVELVAAVGIGHQAAGPGLRGLDWGRQLIPTATECHWGAAGESGVPHLGTGCGIALRALRGTGDAPLTWRVTGVPISVIFQRTGSPICLRGIEFAVGWWGAGQKARRSPQVGTSRSKEILKKKTQIIHKPIIQDKHCHLGLLFGPHGNCCGLPLSCCSLGLECFSLHLMHKPQ